MPRSSSPRIRPPKTWPSTLSRVTLSLLGVLVGCGSGQRPVQVPPSAAELPVGSCAQVRLQSHWGARTPIPASDIEARCTDSNVCSTHVSQQQAGLVYVKGKGGGATLVELDFRDPVTKRREHKTTRVSFVGTIVDAGADVPPPAEGDAPPDDGCGPDAF